MRKIVIGWHPLAKSSSWLNTMYPWVQSRMLCLTQAKCSNICSWCALYILMQHVFKFNDIIYIVNLLSELLILITSYSYLLKELVLCHVSKQVMCCGGFLLFPVSWLTSCFLTHFLFPDSLPVSWFTSCVFVISHFPLPHVFCCCLWRKCALWWLPVSSL